MHLDSANMHTFYMKYFKDFKSCFKINIFWHNYFHDSKVVPFSFDCVPDFYMYEQKVFLRTNKIFTFLLAVKRY